VVSPLVANVRRVQPVEVMVPSGLSVPHFSSRSPRDVTIRRSLRQSVDDSSSKVGQINSRYVDSSVLHVISYWHLSLLS